MNKSCYIEPDTVKDSRLINKELCPVKRLCIALQISGLRFVSFKDNARGSDVSSCSTFIDGIIFCKENI